MTLQAKTSHGWWMAVAVTLAGVLVARGSQAQAGQPAGSQPVQEDGPGGQVEPVPATQPLPGSQASPAAKPKGAVARFLAAAADSPWKDVRTLVGDFQGEVFTGNEQKMVNELYICNFQLEPTFRGMIDEEVVDRKFNPVDCRDVFDGKQWFRSLNHKEIHRIDLKIQMQEKMSLALALLAAGPGLAHGPFVLTEKGEEELDGRPAVRFGLRYEEGHPLNTGLEHEVVLDAETWEPLLLDWKKHTGAPRKRHVTEGEVARRGVRHILWKPVARAEGGEFPHVTRWEFRGDAPVDGLEAALEKEEARAQEEENPSGTNPPRKPKLDPNRLRRRMTVQGLKINTTLDEATFQGAG